MWNSEPTFLNFYSVLFPSSHTGRGLGVRMHLDLGTTMAETNRKHTLLDFIFSAHQFLIMSYVLQDRNLMREKDIGPAMSFSPCHCPLIPDPKPHSKEEGWSEATSIGLVWRNLCLSPTLLQGIVGHLTWQVWSPRASCPSCMLWFHAHQWCQPEWWVSFVWSHSCSLGFPGGASGKEPTCQCRRCKRTGLNPWVRKIPWRRAWQPALVFLPGESHEQRSLGGYGP